MDLVNKNNFYRLSKTVIISKLGIIQFMYNKVKEPNVDQCFFLYKDRNYFKCQMFIYFIILNLLII